MKSKTLVNCDMGESFSIFRCGNDDAIMPHIDIANVACGFHAADPVVMQKTVRLAKTHHVGVGAHPSFPDLQGFGRREMRMQRNELAACIIYQIGALKAFLDIEGMPLNHIKPHGALYVAASRDAEVANAVSDAAQHFNVPVLGMANTTHEEVYTARGLRFLAEYYCDTDYNDDGSLILSREHERRDLDDAVRKSITAIEHGKARSINGVEFPMRADCICVHSDTPGAEDLARVIREAMVALESHI